MSKSENPYKPPRWADNLLKRFCSSELTEEILGDLHERYALKVQKVGERKAKQQYVGEVWAFIRLANFKRNNSDYYSPQFTDMLVYYLKIAGKNIFRNKVFSGFSIFGLGLGIAAVLYILIYLDFELNFDHFHEKADRVYRIETPSVQTHEKEIEVNWRSTPANLASYFQEDYPGIEAFVRVYQYWQQESIELQFENNEVAESAIYATDADLLKVFSIDVFEGNTKTALIGPDKIIISKSLAKRIFGDQDPIAKIINSNLINESLGKNQSFLVTGVFQDIPKNSNIQAEAFISAESDPHLSDYYFNEFNVNTYVLLNEKADVENLAASFSSIYDKYLNADREPVLVRANHALVPLTAIHFNETGGETYMYIFSGVAILLLLIAGISYVNMVTAQASKKALEVGIRKVMGSHRTELVKQFLTESFLFTFLAMVFGVLLLFVSMDGLNQMLGLQLGLSQFWQWSVLLGMLAILIFIGFIGGSYPAFFLSAFKPAAVMKGKLVKNVPFRKVLVGVQFAIVIFVLTCTGMIYDQLQFLRKKDLGFSKDQLVMLSLPSDYEADKWEVFKNEVLQNQFVEAAATASFIPGGGNMRRGPVSAEGESGEVQKISYIGRFDYDFLKTMDINLVSGRNFSTEFPADVTESAIVNEQFVKDYDLGNALGKKVRFGSKDNPKFFEVVGVVKDFHQSSLHSAIEPQMFLFRNSDMLALKIKQDVSAGMEVIEKHWAEIFPNTTFEYRFLDDALQRAYEADQVRGKVFFTLSIITIIISFMGLFGLASYLSKQRIKEVGIRKVLGASVGDLVVMMSRDFVLLVLIAALPAFITAWNIVNIWLENFAFRTEMNYLLFGLVLLFTLLLTFSITALHALQTAHLNPAKTLKYE
ncbi:MAG: hypothetical protein CMO01_01460 [Thalassobius sp.]|nr:hypothetical protein [Thalassovita sp.]